MIKNDDKLSLSRRQFTSLLASFMSVFGIMGATRAGIDNTIRNRRGKRLPKRGLITSAQAQGISLRIDFLPDDGWRIINRLSAEDWARVELDPDDLSPRMVRQLEAAKAAKYGTPVLALVHGDPIAVFDQANYFRPGDPDDRQWNEYKQPAPDYWRVEWFGDGIRRIAPDNDSWWQTRLAVPLEFSKRERAFASAWLKENTYRYGINYGEGLAQDLMLSTHRHENPAGFDPWLTNRERKILATFVQWLGTNCGQSFLYEVKRLGGLP